MTSNEATFLGNIINQKTIPPHFYDKVLSALRSCLFDKPVIRSELYLLIAERYISLLSSNDREILLSEMMDLLSEPDARKQQNAIILLSVLVQQGVAKTNKCFDYVMRTIAEKDASFLKEISKSLIKLATSAKEKNDLFVFAFSLLGTDNERYNFAKDILEKCNLNSDQKDIILQWSYDRIEITHFNNSPNNHELYTQLLFLEKITIPNKWCGLFVDLLVKIQHLFRFDYEYLFLTKTIVNLSSRITQPIFLTLDQAADFVNNFQSVGINYSHFHILSKFISFLPIDVQIGLMTHAENLPVGFSAFNIEDIHVRLELEDSRREMPREVWKHVYKHV